MLGPRLVALLSTLTVAAHLSRRKVVNFCREVLGLPLSLGTVARYEKETAAALDQPHQEARQAVQEAAVRNADETSWTLSGRVHWLWLAATQAAAFFRIDPRRNNDGLPALLGTKQVGVLISDRLAAYLQWAKQRWQMCWSHLRRDFQGLVDLGGENAALGQSGLATGKAMFAVWHEFRNGQLTRAQLQAALVPLQASLREGLSKARDGPKCKARSVARKLLVSFDSLWTFAYHEGVEPTNNHAERLLRQPVIWRRISFGSQSDEGCRYAERLLTTVETLKLQKRSVLHYLEQAIRNHRANTPCPSLLTG